MLGASWEPVPVDGFCNLEGARPTSGIIQVFLVPALGGELAKATWKNRCWILDLKKEEVLVR